LSIRVSFLLTHPIQYYSPFFRELDGYSDIDITVLFVHQPTSVEQGEGFGVSFNWDIDLTSGYKSRFIGNVSRKPTQGFWGYNTPHIKREIIHLRPDIFITQGWASISMLQALFACKQLNIPVAVRSDSQLPQIHCGGRWRLKQFLKYFIYPIFLRSYDLCLPYGTRSAEYFNHYGIENPQVVPHVVDVKSFANESFKAKSHFETLRRKFAIPKDALCFIFCGKFELKKRPLDILKAVCELKKIRLKKKFHILFVGSGGLEKELRTFSENNNIPVSFSGFLNQGEIHEVYAVSDVLILPSDSRETWGLVVNEAMACGLPSIVSNSCGCAPDMIVDRYNGFTYNEGDISQLVSKMNEMFNSDLREFVGANARTTAHSKFSISTAADRFVKAIVGYIKGNGFD
jgi:glycosyltransferase involved in cell wall biosynthesis